MSSERELVEVIHALRSDLIEYQESTQRDLTRVAAALDSGFEALLTLYTSKQQNRDEKPHGKKADKAKPQPGKTLTYRDKENNETALADYVVNWTDKETVLPFTAYEPIHWDSKPVQWLLDKVKETGYESKTQGSNALIIYVPKGEKFGPILGWVSWAFYASTMEESNNNAAHTS